MILVKRFALAMAMSFCSEGAIAQEMAKPASHQVVQVQVRGASEKPVESVSRDCR